MDRRGRILDFIETYILEHGYSPTLREVGAACGISSLSVVNYHVRRLEEDGRITRTPTIARSIRVVASVS